VKLKIESINGSVKMAGLLIPVALILASCGSSSNEDLSDAMTITPEKSKVLSDFFNGTPHQNTSDTDLTNTQTTLLFAILGVVIIIALLISFKIFKKK
jgi:ABC-type transport system involved in multi-copper enzyme maturation permease subunit